MRFSIVLIACLLGSQALNAQKRDKNCALSVEVPSRMLMISTDDKEAVYRDRKTNAILTFTKAGLTDYEFDMEFTANQVLTELNEDPSYKGAAIATSQMDYADVYVLEWAQNTKSPNRKNDAFSMAMMNVCGQYYTFTLNLPESRRKEVMPLFDDMLATIEKTKTKN